MITRAVFACGLSELMLCSWIIDSLAAGTPARNILVIYGRDVSMPEPHKEETLRRASLFGVWDDIIDLTAQSDRLACAGSLAEALDVVGPIAAQLFPTDEILTHTLWKSPEKFFADFCPNARIILFDNGLDSHSQRTLVDQKDDYSLNSVRVADLERVSTCVYTLGDLAPPPAFAERCKIIVPEAACFRDHLFRLGTSGVFAEFAGLLPRTDEVSTIGIGTAFFRTGKVSREIESRAYTPVFDDAARNRSKVLWKEHPRAPAPLLLDDTASIPIPTSLPVEFLPFFRNITMSASISSSALLTLKKLHSIPFRLLGASIADRLSLSWMDVLKAHAVAEAHPS